MSRLSDLLRQARQADPQLGADLEKEVSALLKRRTFGLVFERHKPEAVELPGCPVRRGDKVRVLPPRGEVKGGDQRLWRVERIERTEGERVAHLREIDVEEPETQVVLVQDLVVVAEFKDRIYPGLVETGRVERGGPEGPYHTVINAENYHALEMLTYTHRHMVDVIYIDPPYNTGARDWKYNNDYVEGDDAYRHSKWLAFMERRLRLARELLNPEESVLVVTIDEKEVHRLGLLLDQVFPDAKRQMVSIVIQNAGNKRLQELGRVDEYAFFCFFGEARPNQWVEDFLNNSPATPNTQVRWESLLRSGNNSTRLTRPGLFYPIAVDRASLRVVGAGGVMPKDAPWSAWGPAPDGTVWVWPTKSTGAEACWQLGPAALLRARDEGRLRVGKVDLDASRGTFWYLGRSAQEKIESGEFLVTGRDETGALQVEVAADRTRSVPIKTVWNRQRHHAGWHGTNFLAAMLPARKFPFPKSLYAVEDALRVAVGHNRDAVVLDFFAGSGTTAHAVMRLNRQDGGTRRSISVTNNEVSAEEQQALRRRGSRRGDPAWEALGICDYITKPRVTAAITGQTPDGDPIRGSYKFVDEFPMSQGFDESAAFFTLTYESALAVRHHRAFERVAPMLWMRAGSRGRIINDLGEDGWDVSEVYAVLENLDQLSDFVRVVEGREDVRMVFVVTDDDAAFQMAVRDLPDRVTSVRLYSSYLENFALNIGGDV